MSLGGPSKESWSESGGFGWKAPKCLALILSKRDAEILDRFCVTVSGATVIVDLKDAGFRNAVSGAGEFTVTLCGLACWFGRLVRPENSLKDLHDVS